MQSAKPQAKQALWKQINEDWWSVITGLALVILVAIGIISSVPW